MVHVLSPLLCWFALSHLSLSRQSRRFNLEMGSVLWTRSAAAWSCPAPWPHLCQFSHLEVLPSNLAEHVPAPGLPATVSSGWEGPGKHSLLQGDKLGSCQPFLAGRAATCVVPFQEHWNSPICSLPQTALLPSPTGLPQGLNCYHYKGIPLT